MSGYKKYSEALKEKYGEKVYKLPININVSCPNRDGKIGTLGCIFCGEMGAGFESLSNSLSVKDQLEQNMKYIGKKYGANKFIAFFQNYTNTYMSAPKLKAYAKEACLENIVEICFSTRPDCITENHLKVLKELQAERKINISIELGLQTANYKTLKIIKRGHGLAEFINCVNLVHSYGFPVCAHVIADLPWDDEEDVRETARILSSLKVEGVKLHSLYIVKNTPCAKMYQEGILKLLTKEDYINRAILFIRNLHRECAVERIIGRAPQDDTLIANFNTGWWKIKEEIEEIMDRENYSQGDLLKLDVF
ncbi:MAG: TIGR01212 family radical SAM protein [Clostridia bacterium]|nr:TIGR01212 family radical SAM protein [Clostridia bacterium]